MRFQLKENYKTIYRKIPGKNYYITLGAKGSCVGIIPVPDGLFGGYAIEKCNIPEMGRTYFACDFPFLTGDIVYHSIMDICPSPNNPDEKYYNPSIEHYYHEDCLLDVEEIFKRCVLTT